MHHFDTKYTPYQVRKKRIKHNDSSSLTKTPRNQISGEVMMIIFFNPKWFICQHVVNDEYYGFILKILHKCIPKKCLELVGNWTFYHDNARPHVDTSSAMPQQMQCYYHITSIYSRIMWSVLDVEREAMWQRT